MAALDCVRKLAARDRIREADRSIDPVQFVRRDVAIDRAEALQKSEQED